MTEPDHPLRDTLRRWTGPAPGPEFDAAVWRRIRTRPQQTALTERLRFFIEPWLESRSAFAAACVFAVALSWSAIFAPRQSTGAQSSGASFSSPTPGSLSSAYVRLMTGDPR